jgi:hypothetical protein
VRIVLKTALLSVILLVWIANDGFSQADSTRTRRNIVFVEGAGPGGYGSIGYERILIMGNRFSGSARAGISTFHFTDFTGSFNPDLVFPLAVMAGYGKSHHAEVGIGETITSIVHASPGDFAPVREIGLHTFFSIGYSYRKPSGGLFVRCAYTPIIQSNKYLRHWAGISAGYVF